MGGKKKQPKLYLGTAWNQFHKHWETIDLLWGDDGIRLSYDPIHNVYDSPVYGHSGVDWLKLLDYMDLREYNLIAGLSETRFQELFTSLGMYSDVIDALHVQYEVSGMRLPIDKDRTIFNKAHRVDLLKQIDEKINESYDFAMKVVMEYDVKLADRTAGRLLKERREKLNKLLECAKADVADIEQRITMLCGPEDEKEEK